MKMSRIHGINSAPAWYPQVSRRSGIFSAYKLITRLVERSDGIYGTCSRRIGKYRKTERIGKMAQIWLQFLSGDWCLSFRNSFDKSDVLVSSSSWVLADDEIGTCDSLVRIVISSAKSTSTGPIEVIQRIFQQLVKSSTEQYVSCRVTLNMVTNRMIGCSLM
jgi:hypothetical protein